MSSGDRPCTRASIPRSSDSMRRASCFVVFWNPKASEASPRPVKPPSVVRRTTSQTVRPVARTGNNSIAVTRIFGAAPSLRSHGVGRLDNRKARRLVFTRAGSRGMVGEGYHTV